MADFNRFNQLLISNDYNVIEYYSYNGYCVFVKIIHIISGTIFFVSILRRYRLVVPSNMINHYTLLREDPKSKEFTSAQLNDYYPMIQINPDIIDGSEDVTGQIKVSYKQPISIHKTTASEYLEQMKRLKHCFKTLEYKIVLQSDLYIINLNIENTIDIFKIENHPKTNAHTFYVVCTLEQFYARLNVIHDMINQVEIEFYDILDINQQKHTQYLNTHYIESFVNNNNRILRSKQGQHQTYRDICKLLIKLQEKELACSEKVTKINNRSSNNIFNDATNIKEREQAEQEYKTIHTTKLQVLDKLLKLDSKIKNLYLVIDQLGFNLSLSFNELKNELHKMLL